MSSKFEQEKQLFKAMYETLHKLEDASGERLYIHSNASGFRHLLSVSGMIIAQAPDTATLHARMLEILSTYEKESHDERR